MVQILLLCSLLLWYYILEHDVFGARRAGLECIAVSYGYGTEEELKNAHPFKIVNSAEEILDFFA